MANIPTLQQHTYKHKYQEFNKPQLKTYIVENLIIIA